MFDMRDRRRHLAIILFAGLVGLAGSLSAQVPKLTPASPPAASDPLGRTSPFGTVSGLSAAVRRNDFVVASRFLLLSGQNPEEVEALARDLSDLLDRYFRFPLTALSLSQQGDLTDGLEPERERIPLTIGDKTVDLFLTRITDPDVGPIWLFAPDTLQTVPTLKALPQTTWVEDVMPAPLVDHSYLGLSAAQWVLWAVSIAIPLLAALALAVLVAVVIQWRVTDPTRRTVFLAAWKSVRWPFVAALTLAVHLAAVRLLGFGLSFRVNYARIGLVVGIIVGLLLTWRLVTITFHYARLLAMRRGRSDTRSLMLLSERVVKVLVVVIALFGLLTLAGLDPATALAGLGIVGVAMALGAQKSVENLLGGIFLLTDKALAVGDYCRLSDREGWVEDITLRSVRLRTLEQTLLSVPAGLLAQGSIEVISARAKILFQSVLRLRYGTTAEQLQAVLDGTGQLLANHPKVDQERARVRLIAFGAQAIEVEVFAYIATDDFMVFLEVRQGLLLQIAALIESSGGGFAGPTQFIHMDASPASESVLPLPRDRSEFAREAKGGTPMVAKN